jgi:long-chain acyl-CoA synthetase
MQTSDGLSLPPRLVDWFHLHEQELSGSKAFLEGRRRTTYRELFGNVRHLGNFFAESGLAGGSRVVIASNDDAAVSTLFIAITCYGHTAVVLDPNAAIDEIARLLVFSDAEMQFLDADIVDKLDAGTIRQAINGLVRITEEPRQGGIGRFFGRKGIDAAPAGSYHSLLAGSGSANSIPIAADPDQTAYILFTSGTTSTPKGVEITYRGLEAQLSIFLRQYVLDKDTRLLNLLPLHHADGLIQGPILAFAAGATIFRPFRFSVQAIPELLDAVYRFRITHFIAVPSVLALIRDFASDYTEAFRTDEFRFIVSTAAYLEEQLWRQIENDFAVTIVNVYGLTETVCEALYCGPDDATRKVGTIGVPIGCDTRIVDDQGHDVSPGTSGELLIRGDIVMKGYFRLPEETAEVLRNGWLYSGDIACVDDDGYYRIVGRKKNVLIVGGINVYPEDLATVILAMPGVRDAVVIGLDDAIWGDIPVACVVPVDGVTLSTTDVQGFFLTRSSQAMLPRQIHFFENVPRGPAGKVLLNELRESVLRRNSAVVENVAATSADIVAQTMKIATRVFKTDPDQLSIDLAFSDIGQWDSLTHVEFLFSLEKEFGIRLAPREIFGLRTLGDAVSIVRSKRDSHSRK